MPVRARSRFLHLGDPLLAADRLMPRSSSSSAIDAVAHDAAVARDAPAARRAACARARRARPRRSSSSADEAPARAAPGTRSRSMRTRGTARERLAQRHEIARPGRAERGARDEALDVVHRLQRFAQLTRARCRGTRSPRRRRADPGCARARRSGRSSHARSSRPPIGVIVRSISCSSDPVRPPSAASITSRFLSVVGSTSRQSAPRAERDVADVREVGLLRVAQALHERAGGADGGADGRRARSPGASARLQLAEQRAARRLALERPAARPASARASMRDAVSSAAAVLEPGRRQDLARPQDRELVARAPCARPRRCTPRS